MGPFKVFESHWEQHPPHTPPPSWKDLHGCEAVIFRDNPPHFIQQKIYGFTWPHLTPCKMKRDIVLIFFFFKFNHPRTFLYDLQNSWNTPASANELVFPDKHPAKFTFSTFLYNNIVWRRLTGSLEWIIQIWKVETAEEMDPRCEAAVVLVQCCFSCCCFFFW